MREFHPNKIARDCLIEMPSGIKKRSEIERPPKIVTSVNINKLPATSPEIPESLNHVEVPGSNSPKPGDEFDPERFLVTNEPHATLVSAVKRKKNVVLNEAEVMPSYSGGIKALLLFLKKNIQLPEDVGQGEKY